MSQRALQLYNSGIAVSASPDYTSGDCVGGKLTLRGVVSGPGHAAILDSIVINDAANQKPDLDILIFDSDLSAATTTDNGAFAFSTDISKLIAKISVAADNYSTTNSMATAHLTDIGAIVSSKTGTEIYAVLVATSAPNFAATTDLTVRFGFRKA